MCVVLDEVGRPDWLVGALDDSSTRAGCRWSSSASRTSSGRSGSSWRRTTWCGASAGSSSDDVCQAERGRADAAADGLPNVAPATAPPRRACAVDWCRRSRARSGAVGEHADRVIPPRRARDPYRAAAERRDGSLRAPARAGRRPTGVWWPGERPAAVQHACRRTITDAAGLAFAEHHICDADVLFRVSFYQSVFDAAARYLLVSRSWSSRTRRTGSSHRAVADRPGRRLLRQEAEGRLRLLRRAPPRQPRDCRRRGRAARLASFSSCLSSN